MVKAGVFRIIETQKVIFEYVWESKVLPKDWKKVVIIPLNRYKGSRREFRIYRLISVL